MRSFWCAAVLLATACAEPSGTAPGAPRVPTYSAPIVLFIHPEPDEIERLHRQLGDDDFYVTADDAMWYRAGALELLDSLRIPHAEVPRGEARFLVRGESRVYSWSEVDLTWFLVLYDGESEPTTISSIDLHQHVHRLAPRGSR